MARINTSKLLSTDGYFSSVDFSAGFGLQSMTISPLVSDLYDYVLTEDIVLLNERNDTAEKLYTIWMSSPFIEQYTVDTSTDTSTLVIPKIPKDLIKDIFYYMKNELAKIKTLSAYEMVISINEFFDFNYDYVVKKVLSPKIKSEILEEYYNNGMKERMDNNASEKLF